jgi:shikimate dehydrogenase
MAISGRTQVVAVIGDPVEHSRSPVIHNGWITDARLDAVYVALRLTGADPAARLAALPDLGIKGANVTLPHKDAALACATAATDAARAIGAANTLFLQDGAWTADNTDAAGLVSGLESRAPDWREAGSSVVVLGAGGAARAAVHGLAVAGAPPIRVVNRTLARAQAVAGLASGALALGWDGLADALDGAGLVVNCTSRGLSGRDPLTLDLTPTASNAIVLDTVYTPLDTALLASARAQGRRALDGLDMLVGQAALSFERWFGIAPDRERGRARALETLS